MESFTVTYHRTPKGEGRVGSKKMAQETTRDGHVSEMIHDHSKSAVKLLEPSKYPKTGPDTISDGDRWLALSRVKPRVNYI